MADLLYQSVLEKFTGEQFNEAFNFDGVIPENTTVTTASVLVTKADGTDATATVFKAKSISSTTVTVTLYTGTTEASYIVQVTVAASDTTPQRMVKLLNVTAAGVYR